MRARLLKAEVKGSRDRKKKRKQGLVGKKIFNGWITATKFPHSRQDGSNVRFDKNLTLLFRGNLYRKKETLIALGNKRVMKGPCDAKVVLKKYIGDKRMSYRKKNFYSRFDGVRYNLKWNSFRRLV